MQHHVFIIPVLTEFNSSIKCHLWDNIYNTVIYCNNWGLKFHKKRNKTALPLPTTWIDLPKTSEMSLPNFRLLICWWGIGSVRLALLHPSGCITFPGIMSILPGAVYVSNFGRKECLRCWVSVCVCVFVSVCDWFVGLLGVCLVVCLFLSLCVSMRVCQRLWQVCRFRAAVLLTPWSLSPFSGRQVRPSPQSQRWNSSKPWVPFLRWRVHTWPSVSTGLQIRDQKCLAQHRPSEQSADLRQVSPSWPAHRVKRDETLLHGPNLTVDFLWCYFNLVDES